MIRWDLATDEFEIGQWLKARVYEHECDLSPDGRLFTYQALDGHFNDKAQGIYSVVCRPPFFTALALWAQGTTYERGFRWSRSAVSFLRCKAPTPTKGTLPKGYATLLREADVRVAVLDRGWSNDRFQTPTLLTRGSVAGTLAWSLDERHWPGGYWLGNQSFEVNWADVDHQGRLLLAREGRVLVRDEDGEREMIDLNLLTFRPLPPPEWATKWP